VTPIAWAERYFKPIGSGKAVDYDTAMTPWVREPMEHADERGLNVFIGPIQSGKSALGEAVLLRWLSRWSRGDIGYYWQSDDSAEARWTKHFERKLRACEPVMAKLAKDRHKFTKGLIALPKLNFVMQGVFSDRTVASDSFRGEVLEEVHDEEGGWSPGRVAQALGRQTAFWDAVCYIISNAGIKGSELHKAYEQGTRQVWEVQCPGCKAYHVLRMRWQSDRPDLGGLRYDMDGQPEHGEPDYNKLAPTVRYQMPCGYLVRDNLAERRPLSMAGRFTPAAPAMHRSYTFEAVSIHDISWLQLIREKQTAWGARKRGDARLWLTYLRERECQFIGAEDRRPEVMPIVLSSKPKDREGMANRQYRLAAFDYQTGRKEMGESPHFWGMVQDFDAIGNSLIVWEGKCNSEGEVLDIIYRHQVKPFCALVDASWAGEDRYVYSFCCKNGLNAIKIHGDRTFAHKDGVRRAWTEPEELWHLVPNQDGPSKEDPDLEPLFWNISQTGAMDALAHLRARKDRTYEVPKDISPEFLEHFKAWSLEETRVPATNQLELRWKKISERHPDHLYMCATYLALWAELLAI
jgi:hypothetical protein